MNDVFYEMIFRRKSFHIFRNVGNESIGEYELNDIQNAFSEFAPLNPEIQIAIHIVPEKNLVSALRIYDCSQIGIVKAKEIEE